MLACCLTPCRKNQHEIAGFSFIALLHLNQLCWLGPITMKNMTGVAGAADTAYCLFTAYVTFLAFAYLRNRHIRTLVGMHDVVAFGAF